MQYTKICVVYSQIGIALFPPLFLFEFVRCTRF